MRTLLFVSCLVGTVVLTACGSSLDMPPSSPGLWLDFPPGMTREFANINPGNSVTIGARVLNRDGEPVAGVEVIWDDLFRPAGAQPERSFTNAEGLVSATWLMRPLNNGVFSARQNIKGYVIGADNSPIEYRALVVRCTRC